MQLAKAVRCREYISTKLNLNAAAGLVFCQGFITSDNVEQFRINTVLAQAMKGRKQALGQLVDVELSARHGRKAAGILAGK